MIRLFLNNSLEISKYLIVFSVLMHAGIYRGKRRYVGLCILTGGILLCSFVLKTDNTLLAVIYSCAVIIILYQGYLKAKIMYFLLAFLSVNYADAAIFALMGFVLQGKIWWYFIYESGWESTGEKLISFGILLIAAVAVGGRRKQTVLFNRIDLPQYSLFLCAMTGLYVIFMIIMMFMAYGSPDYRNRLYLLLSVSAALTIACIMAFFIYSNRLKKENELHMQNIRLYEENTRRTRDYLDEIKSINDDIRKYRHDFRHHVAAMEGLAEEGEYAELKGYLDQLAEINKDLDNSRIIYTGSYIVDAIICGVKSEEAFQDAEFVCDGMLPEFIGIRDTDLCTVLANGLENALEASLTCKNAHIVQLRAGCYGSIIKFQIKNTYDGGSYEALAANDFHSTKTDGERHGYGIKSMRRVVKKYHGKLEYHVEKEWVTTEIYMQQEFEQKLPRKEQKKVEPETWPAEDQGEGM